MIPLYGFVEGDTLGILVLAYETETVAELASKLQDAASVRVARRGRVELLHEGRVLESRCPIAAAGIEPLDRIDLRVVHDMPK